MFFKKNGKDVIFDMNELKQFSCSFDFKAMNAFSIERQYDFKLQTDVTVIGYVKNENIEEWCIHCSKESHEELVKKFNEFMSMK